MYSPFQLVAKYFQFWWKASNSKGHGVHSPFVYDFIRKVLIDKTSYSAYAKVDNWKSQLLADRSVLAIEDLGAGSRKGNNLHRSIAEITQNASKPKKVGRLLFRIVQYYKPATILELGTSMGLSTAYFSLANSASTIVTIEGASSVAKQAVDNFSNWGIANVKLINGNFDTVLPAVLDSLDKLDFAFVDGNHRKAPTLQYFDLLLKKSHPGTIIIFDDIHWSKEMEEAWEVISTHTSVKCSIDLFYMGIILLRTDFYQLENFSIPL